MVTTNEKIAAVIFAAIAGVFFFYGIHANNEESVLLGATPTYLMTEML